MNDTNVKNFFIKLLMTFSYIGMMMGIFFIQINDRRFHLLLESIVNKYNMTLSQVIMLAIVLLIIFSFIILVVQTSIYQTILKLFNQSVKSTSKIFPSIIFSTLFSNSIFIICSCFFKLPLFFVGIIFPMISLAGLAFLFYFQTKDKKASLIVSLISLVFLMLNMIFAKQ